MAVAVIKLMEVLDYVRLLFFTPGALCGRSTFIDGLYRKQPRHHLGGNPAD
jgi:hypothetical protein